MDLIVTKETTEINNQSIIPSASGFQPTDLILSTESPAPIKNRVTVSPVFDMFEMKLK